MFGLRLFIVSHVPFLHPRFVPTVIHFTRRCGSCSANHRELSFRENGVSIILVFHSMCWFLLSLAQFWVFV